MLGTRILTILNIVIGEGIEELAIFSNLSFEFRSYLAIFKKVTIVLHYVIILQDNDVYSNEFVILVTQNVIAFFYIVLIIIQRYRVKQ